MLHTDPLPTESILAQKKNCEQVDWVGLVNRRDPFQHGTVGSKGDYPELEINVECE